MLVKILIWKFFRFVVVVSPFSISDILICLQPTQAVFLKKNTD